MNRFLIKRTYLPLGHVFALVVCTVPMPWSAALAQNNTPSKKKVVFYSGTYNDANRFADLFRKRFEAEGYTFETYLHGTNPKQATLENFYKAATANDYAVFIYSCHGTLGSSLIEEFEDDDAPSRDDKYKEYRHKDGYKQLWTTAFSKYIEKGEAGDQKKKAIKVTWQGMRQMFAGAAPQTMVFIISCDSWSMQQANKRKIKVFGDAHVFATDFGCSGTNTGDAYHEVMKNLTGETNAPGKRSVVKGFDAQATLVKDARLKLRGDGKITLAPSVVAAVPAVVPPVPPGAPVPGSVSFDTIMDTANAVIVGPGVPDYCGLVFGAHKWAAGAQKLDFMVHATLPGRFSVAEVDPVLAVSKNNQSQLIGNMWELQAGAGPPRWFIPKPPLDRSMRLHDFGTNGYDGVGQAGAIANNPYRWCIFCNDPPQDPPGGEPDPPRGIDTPYGPVDIPWAESTTYLVMDGAAGENIVMTAMNLPSNFTFVQTGNWYGHVSFSPTMAQLNCQYLVTFESSDGSGVRYTQNVSYEVVDREESLAVEHVHDQRAFQPGEEIALELVLSNDGNTKLRDLLLTAGAISGPAVIAPANVSIEPNFVSLLRPGQSIAVQVTVTSEPSNPGGLYQGAIPITATTAVGTYQTQGAVDFHLTHEPELGGASAPIQTFVGDTLSIDLSASDADGDDLTYYLSGWPEGSELTPNGGGVNFSWQPQAHDVGREQVMVIASDGLVESEFGLDVDVDGPVNLVANPQGSSYHSDLPVPLEVAYLNRNDEPTLLSERIEVFENGLSGPLIWSDEQVVGELQPDEEMLRERTVPALPGPYIGLGIRVTSLTALKDQQYSEVSDFLFPDCNANGIFDSADLASRTSMDVNVNGIPDECDPDCNQNDTPDDLDISGGQSGDLNSNGIPDSCDLDCNGNQVPDDLDIASSSSADLNRNGVPDECDCREVIVFADDMEQSTLAWVVQNEGPAAGAWQRVQPIGATAHGQDLSAPDDDATPGPGGWAFVTGNGLPGAPADSADVEGGPTCLWSPFLKLRGTQKPMLSYDRWFYCDDFGASESESDLLTVVLWYYGPGGEWAPVELETVETTNSGWVHAEFDLDLYAEGTPLAQVLFCAADLGSNSITEAGVDNFKVAYQQCGPQLPPTCASTNDCADQNGDNRRDDGCLWAHCVDSACESTDIIFADVGGSFGACPPDGFANLFDRNHVLTCFSSTNPCNPFNIDVGGAFGACPPDGFCNLFDAIHVLTAFAGTNQCTCPANPAPDSAPLVVGQSTLSVVADASAVRPGDTVAVRVYLDEPLKDFQGYQLHLASSGGNGGALELVDIAVENGTERIFKQDAGVFDAFSVTKGQMLFSLEEGGVQTFGHTYLATFTYRATADASGTFVVDARHDEAAGDQTFLVSDFVNKIEVTRTAPATIAVVPSRRVPK